MTILIALLTASIGFISLGIGLFLGYEQACKDLATQDADTYNKVYKKVTNESDKTNSDKLG